MIMKSAMIAVDENEWTVDIIVMSNNDNAL